MSESVSRGVLTIEGCVVGHDLVTLVERALNPEPIESSSLVKGNLRGAERGELEIRTVSP